LVFCIALRPVGQPESPGALLGQASLAWLVTFTRKKDGVPKVAVVVFAFVTVPVFGLNNSYAILILLASCATVTLTGGEEALKPKVPSPEYCAMTV